MDLYKKPQQSFIDASKSIIEHSIIIKIINRYAGSFIN